ncbi:GNAT family N-acetyltransferase [Pseudoalteromonas sp. T1lg24]|uniref:GNAT family N-acetyltransferase n=1 Tax=Pseudoalteromonas sp. T1lg24 TaxID=2077099 RepID=UPI001F2FFBA0|nr:GNAT family N-acetyltransferase [Pseudoalteromonas sp. T1lg24]
MQLIPIEPEKLSLALLLEADPNIEKVQAYLANGICFAAVIDNTVIAACIFQRRSRISIELMNIAVQPTYQAQGVGSKLLAYAIAEIKYKGVEIIELGTGTFGHQLSFYQKLGFRVESVIKNHFLDNYPEPIFENGIQHKDMLRLTLCLKDIS